MTSKARGARCAAAPQALTAIGVASAATGVLLATLCCWAPALVIALGIGSLYAALYGYRYLLGAGGAAIVVAGLIWSHSRRGSGRCTCNRGESNGCSRSVS